MRSRAGRPLALALATLLVVGCSGGDDDGGEPSGVASTTVAETVAPPGPPDDTAVVGIWTAEGDSTLEDALASQGLDEAPTCTGTLTVELGADGAFTRTARGSCDFGESTGEVEIVATGGFSTGDGELVLHDLTGSGTIRGSDGEELELPDETAADGGSVAYEVDGDELTLDLTPDDPEADGAVVFRRTS